jgi:hypothetical protein
MIWKKTNLKMNQMGFLVNITKLGGKIVCQYYFVQLFGPKPLIGET